MMTKKRSKAMALLYSFLTMAVDGASSPPGKSHNTHCVGGWLGPRRSLDGCGKISSNRDPVPGACSP